MEENIKNKYDFNITEGIKSANKRNLNKSIDYFKKAISIDNTRYEAFINLSNIYILQKNILKSKNLLMSFLKQNKFNENFYNYSSKIFYNYNFNTELLFLFKLSKLQSNKYVSEKKYLFFVQGNFYERDSFFKEAKESFSKSINCDKKFFESYTKLINLSEKTNDLVCLKSTIYKGLRNFYADKDIAILNLYKAILLNREKKFDESQNLIAKNKLKLLLKEDNKLLLKLLDVESKNLEKLSKFNSAYKKVKEKNDIIINLEENKKFNNTNLSNTIKVYKKFYIKSNIRLINKNKEQYDDKNLVFLVGFPRSGTTLLDTILRTHSRIKVLEEKPFILDLRHKYFTQKNNNLSSLLSISKNEKLKIRNDYYNSIISNPGENNKIIIDKFPLSIIELGFIKCIFPNSKIVLAMRHPCDVVTSCFFSSFKINEAMIKFLSWKNAINFYNEVFDLFEFFEKQLELNYLMVKYENVVKNFKVEVNLLVNYLGLKYENKLEKYYDTAKKRNRISTPSYNQVINPIYNTSIGRWKNYTEAKKSIKDLDRWIKKFSY